MQSSAANSASLRRWDWTRGTLYHEVVNTGRPTCDQIADNGREYRSGMTLSEETGHFGYTNSFYDPTESPRLLARLNELNRLGKDVMFTWTARHRALIKPPWRHPTNGQYLSSHDDLLDRWTPYEFGDHQHNGRDEMGDGSHSSGNVSL